jgi:glycosyltransferase involved in cell wall biosynthesis
MITIYTITYNEELIIQFFINHYRTRFPNCKIVIHDNYSTDNTEAIALQNNCEVIKFDTNNEFRDDIHRDIKNSCWKNSSTKWVVVCDADECLDITQEELSEEQSKGTTIINTQGWNMINLNHEINLEQMQYGYIFNPESKRILFDKDSVSEINYDAGGHSIKPIGLANYSPRIYNLLHYKCLSEDYLVERYKLLNSRLSEINRANRWGFQYTYSEREIRQDYNELKKNVTKLL